jgi:hypothetical protein
VRYGWYWVADQFGGYERWQIDLEIPGSFQRFQYAVCYTHGIVNGAHPYEFWDNARGHNYRIERVP